MNEDDANTLAKSHGSETTTSWFRDALPLVFLIAAILVFFSMAVHQQVEGTISPKQQTRITLRSAMAAITEFEVSEMRMIDHKTEAPPFPMNSGKRTGTAIPDSTIEWIVAELWANERCRKALQSLGKETLADTDGDGFLEIMDGWGTPLIFLNKVSHSDHYKFDDFLAEVKQPCLISAGADGYFGDVSDPKNKWVKDNISSVTLD